MNNSIAFGKNCILNAKFLLLGSYYLYVFLNEKILNGCPLELDLEKSVLEEKKENEAQSSIQKEEIEKKNAEEKKKLMELKLKEEKEAKETKIKQTGIQLLYLIFDDSNRKQSRRSTKEANPAKDPGSFK